MNIRHLSRRGFLNMGAAAGAGLILPKTGLIRPALAQTALPPVAEADAKISFAYVGPTADEGWTWAHDQGRQAVEAAFPELTTTYVENLPYSADASRILRRMVGEGANMVFVNSNYGDFLYDVADRAPDVAFYECDGRTTLPNMGTYYVQHWYSVLYRRCRCGPDVGNRQAGLCRLVPGAVGLFGHQRLPDGRAHGQAGSHVAGHRHQTRGSIRRPPRRQAPR